MATKKRTKRKSAKRRSAPKKTTGKKRGRKKGYTHSAATKRKIAAKAKARYRAGKSALVKVNAGKRRYPRHQYASLEDRARARHARRHKFTSLMTRASAHAGLAKTVRGTVVTPYMQLLRKRQAERRAHAPAHSATEQGYFGFAL